MYVSPDLIGEFYTTVNELQIAYKQSRELPVINEKKKKKKGAKYKNSGTVRKKSKISSNGNIVSFSFFDFNKPEYVQSVQV